MSDTDITKREAAEAQGGERTRPGRIYRPNVDICETEEGLLLWADLPGVDEGAVQIRLENGVLSIEGRVSASEYENLRPVYTEYRVGDYAQSFALSDEIDSDRIRARMRHGVLELELPKAAKARPRRIEVTAA